MEGVHQSSCFILKNIQVPYDFFMYLWLTFSFVYVI